MRALLKYFHPLEKIERKRKLCVNTVKLPDFLYDVIKSPSPALSDLARETDFIILDLETTGLNSQKDLILSIGWVELTQGRIDLNSAQHMYINTDSQIKPETAIINHITPQMLSEGVPISEAMVAFFKAAQGKMIVAHACVVEDNFIGQYLLKSHGLEKLPLLWLDTLCIEKKMAKAISTEDIDLTLASTRKRYGLPEYNSHNALADAVSTAELLLAQQRRIAQSSDITLGVLYRMSH